jgi:hypothetical protein
MVFYLTSDMILHKLIGQIANLMADGLSRLERCLEVDATAPIANMGDIFDGSALEPVSET